MSGLFSINKNPTRRELRSFGIVMGIAWLVVGCLIAWRGGRMWLPTGLVVGGVGVGLSVVAIAAQGAGRIYYVCWMTVASWMGRVLFPVFLTVLYFVVLPVFSLIRFSDPLRLRLKKDGSYWEPHQPHEPTLERMHRLS